ncbi:efflux RND transporter permease subunit [Candidatus Uabimicrobium amorphum]|uniref:Acriflavin resistance protein n=1 Tax=Uabimicrobium amorphum TaxID=2596890 RepID=A0A5S9ISL7_UABAM|nr:efflux RND transporter permease subunit [Candidatus Uabimicrobium amorphum]BBM86390.1 acriflavin resistance protein [Candidatus Uabimicrobium amorphum]
MNFIDWCVKRPIFCNLLMIFILFSGFIALVNIPNQSTPIFSRDEIEISVLYPGATPLDVEESICIKLENALEDVPEIIDLESIARETLGVVKAKLKVRVDPYKVLEKIKLRVDGIEDFPSGAFAPQTRLRFFSPVLMRFVLYGDLSKRELNKIAKNIRSEVMDLPDVDYVPTQGSENYEVKIEISELSLQKYNLKMSNVSDAIKAHSFSRAEGELKTEDHNIKIYTEKRLYSAKEYETIPIITSENGIKILLRDIARVYEGFDNDNFYYRFNGLPAISMKIESPQEADAITVSRHVKKYLEEKKKQFPENLKLRLWFDRSEFIVDQLITLSNGAITGAILVVACLSIFLTFRVSFWVALGIPISYAGGFFVLFLLGKSLNLISMFAMIIALGIVVDDAIIVGENITANLEKGLSGREAAIQGANEMFLPILGAVSTTVIAFVPLFFIPGMVGNWIREIPIAVIATLVTSLIECMFILPSHLSKKPKKPNAIREKINALIDFLIQKVFATVYKKVLAYKIIFVTLVLGISLIAVGLIQSRTVEYIFFPEVDSLHIRAELRFPSGTSKNVIDHHTRFLEKTVAKLNKSFPNEVPVVNSMFAITDENYGYVEVQLCPHRFRNYHSREIITKWEKIVGEVPDAISINFWEDQYAPTGIPIEIELQSSNSKELLSAANKLKKELYQMNGVYNIHDNSPPQRLVLSANLKDEGIFLGITQQDISQKLSSGFGRQEVFKLQRDSEEVVVRLGYEQSAQELNTLNIQAAGKFEIPLANVVEFVLNNRAQTILRKNKKRFLAIRANINDELITSFDVIQRLKGQFLADLQKLHPGVVISIAGQEKENQQTINYLILGFAYAMLAIFIILALILNSYIQPLIILVILPFGFVGAIYGHWMLHLPISIMSLFGVVALSGILVNDSLVFIDQINVEMRKGNLVNEAVFQAGLSRFRAIVITSFTTIAGLIPTLYETDLEGSSIIPMAVSIVFGLAFATIITLFLVPILFLFVNFCRRVIYWLLKGKWANRENVEPSYKLT